MSADRKILIYVGPSRPFGLPIMRNAILAGEPDTVYPSAKPFFEEHKEFKKLFVPANQLAQARAAMREPGSALSLWGERIKEASDNFNRQPAE